MVASVVSGQRVSLRADSPFAGRGGNPPAGTTGTVTELDGEWATVDWGIGGAETNHKPTELDSIGAPPTNSGEWGWAKAYYDAKNQDVPTILDRLNELSANYDEPFSVMYLLIIASGKAPNRVNVIQLLPTITNGNRDSVTWPANATQPGGTLSVSSTYDATRQCWKMLDGNDTTNWYPASGQWLNSWWQVAFETSCYLTKIEMVLTQGLFRPKRVRIDVGNIAGSLSSAGEFSIPESAGTGVTTETINLNVGIRKIIRVTVLELHGTGLVGYPLMAYRVFGNRL